ncbi:MAG: M20/M25/M40 family metallo-hydrolase [Planctomycetes bacterium]|nr:M20/M25/M40 family metallo-hydrolase [Planctomycetota bacterium]
MRKLLIVVMLVVLSVSCQWGCKQAPVTQPLDKQPANITGLDQLKKDMSFLCGDELAGRKAGSMENLKVALYIAGEFHKIGLETLKPQVATEITPAVYLQTFDVKEKTLQNVVGCIWGSSKKEEAVIIGAHYDHLGMDEKTNQIYYGADDNASGVVALLGVARQLHAMLEAPKRTIIFIAFDGEESTESGGMLGSSNYVKNPLWDLQKTRFMLNLDTIGRMTDKLYVFGGKTIPSLKDVLDKANRETKLNLAYEEISSGSDQVAFWMARVPAYFFFSGANQDYHRPSDTSEKINYEGLEKITGLAGRFIMDIANLPEIEAFKEMPKIAMPSGKPRPYIGTQPGFDSKVKGVLIKGVNPGSPAEKSGLREGDVIIRIDGAEIKEIGDYQKVLMEKKVGDTIKMVVLRDGKETEISVTLEERK